MTDYCLVQTEIVQLQAGSCLRGHNPNAYKWPKVAQVGPTAWLNASITFDSKFGSLTLQVSDSLDN